jgi:hypothetical protein
VLPLLEKFNFQPAATEELIRSSETELGLRLPNPYVDFLRIGNGGEGFIGESYSILWDVSELASLNASYESHKWTWDFLFSDRMAAGKLSGSTREINNGQLFRFPLLAWPLANRFMNFSKDSIGGIESDRSAHPWTVVVYQNA